MNLKKLTNDELITAVESLVRQERQIIEGMIWHLQEIQDRKLFIQMGFTSLFECLVKRFGYSEAVAYTRISALRIMTAVPDAAKALSEGEVTLTTLSLTQSFIRKQEKEAGNKLSVEKKHQYLTLVKNKSTQEVKQVLAELNPALELPVDKITYLSASDIQLHITTDKNLLEKIQKVKALTSHENIDPTYGELLHMAFDALIEKKEKTKGLLIKATKDLVKLEDSTPTSNPQNAKPKTRPQQPQNLTQSNSVKSNLKKPSRYVSRSVKRAVLQRSNHQCEFKHADGSKCGSTFQLQFDHIKAFSHGGNSMVENIQTLCRVHNAFKSNCS